MSKAKKQHALVPKLRFPEFRDAGEWERLQVGDIITLEYGSPLPAKDRTGEGFPVIGSNGVVGYHETAKVSGPAIVVGRKGSVGQISLIEDDCTPIDTTFYVVSKRPKRDDFYFIWRLLDSSRLDTFGDAGAVPGLSRNDVYALQTAVPNLAEQQRIADCLGSLDGLIAAEGRKLAALRDHKKGLMQQVFPREGETVPRLRFPEFQDAGEWEERLIEEFFLVGSSKRVLQQDWMTEGVPFYRTRELVSLSKNEPFSSEVFISEELFSEISEKYGVPAKGDFLVSGVGTLGIAYQVRAGDKFYFKDGNVLWLKLTGDLISDFFKYCFQSDFVQNQILGQASVSTVGTYTIQNAKKTRFLLPMEAKEQQKIANCLSSLDALITSQAAKLDALRTHKRGLMQQLFPQEDH